MAGKEAHVRKMRHNPESVLDGIEPVGKRRSIAETVYHTLKDAIVKGDLKPGQRLVEQKLSDRMRVSRVPVREAIKKLEQYGFVERLPTRGIIVKDISARDIRETFGIRAALEAYAACLACDHVNGELLAALEEIIEESSEALAEGNLERVIGLNTFFHEKIYSAAQSEMLRKLIDTFQDHIMRFRRHLLSSGANARVSLEGHRAMVDAIRRGDRENVERIVKSHVLQGRDFVLRDRGISAPRRLKSVEGS